MKTADLLLVSTMLTNILGKASALAGLQQQAAAEGRGINDDDLDRLGLADDAARARQQLQLQRMPDSGTPG